MIGRGAGRGHIGVKARAEPIGGGPAVSRKRLEKNGTDETLCAGVSHKGACGKPSKLCKDGSGDENKGAPARITSRHPVSEHKARRGFARVLKVQTSNESNVSESRASADTTLVANSLQSEKGKSSKQILNTKSSAKRAVTDNGKGLGLATSKPVESPGIGGVARGKPAGACRVKPSFLEARRFSNVSKPPARTTARTPSNMKDMAEAYARLCQLEQQRLLQLETIIAEHRAVDAQLSELTHGKSPV